MINQDAAKFVERGLSENMFRGLKRKHADWIESIIQRAIERSSSKDKKEAERITKKASKSKVAKLADATGRDRSKCILIVGEGDSAVGGIGQERNPSIHGVMPLRGKIMNVHETTPAQALKSQALADIVSALGLVYGKKADPKNLRYGKLWIATDEDVDGYHILCLLVNFITKYWPELMENKRSPFVNKIETPFIILKKGNQRKYIYEADYHSFKPENYKGWEITRAKGLGTLESQEWKDILNNPRLIGISDDGNMKDTLDLLFNEKRADDRKKWLEGTP